MITLSHLAASATTFLPAADVDNPFDHTTPNITVFGVDFSNKLYAALGGIWGIAFIIAAIYLIIAIVKVSAAKKVQHNPDALSDASANLKLALIALALLGGIGVIFTAAVNIFG